MHVWVGHYSAIKWTEHVIFLSVPHSTKAIQAMVRIFNTIMQLKKAKIPVAEKRGEKLNFKTETLERNNTIYRLLYETQKASQLEPWLKEADTLYSLLLTLPTQQHFSSLNRCFLIQNYEKKKKGKGEKQKGENEW